MSAHTTYLKDALANQVLRTIAYTPPATVYLALFTSATTDAGGGTEVAGGSYARQAITFSASSSGASTNTAAITYVNMPAVTVTHAALMDSASGGNMLLHGPLGSPRTLALADGVTFGPGTLTATF